MPVKHPSSSKFRILLMSIMTVLFVGIMTSLPASALELGGGYTIRTYASPDPDSVNSHFIETPGGVIVISAQRTFSEANRAIARVERIGKPVIAIVIPVPHTDHFGGLTRWKDAWPDADILAAEATITSMRTDGEGYIASRKDALRDDFPSQAEVLAALPNIVVTDGQEIDVDGLSMRFHDLPSNNAPTNTMVELPDHDVLFASEVVEDGITLFLKDADLDVWLDQLDALEADLADYRVFYPAHGSPGAPGPLIAAAKAHLEFYRDGIDAALADDGIVDERETADLVARIEAAYPDHAQVARLLRSDLIAANIGWQTERRSAE